MQTNEGFRRFAEQYNRAMMDEETFNEYMGWLDGLLYEEGIRKAAVKDASLATAKRLLARGLSAADAAELADLPLARVEALITQD